MLLCRYRDWPEVAEVAPSKVADREPYCFPVFRWALMVTGVLLLIAVLLILCQLGMEFSQKYREGQEESDLSTRNQTASNSPEMPNSQR